MFTSLNSYQSFVTASITIKLRYFIMHSHFYQVVMKFFNFFSNINLIKYRNIV